MATKQKKETRTDEFNLVSGFIRECKLPFHITPYIIDVIVDFNESATVIIDNGSGWIKAGFSGDDAPQTVFRSLVARPRHTPYDDIKPNQYVVGEDALQKRSTSTLRYPIEHGIICNWSDVEAIWFHTFEKELLQYKTKQILMTEVPLTPKSNREKMTQMMFETFNMNKFYVAIDAVLALYASGRTTGIVWNHGDAVGHTVPVYDGYCVPHAICRYDIAGSDMTRYLRQMLAEKGYGFNIDQEIMRDIKEKLCYVALDSDAEMRKYEHASDMELYYELPDGRVIAISDERFRATETIFEPWKIGLSAEGMHKLVYNSIMRCDVDIRKDLYANVVVAGGNTLFDGLKERIEKELKMLAPNKMTINVIAPPERRYSTWIGASILCSLSSFEDMWITKEEYDEFGPMIVHRKCT